MTSFRAAIVLVAIAICAASASSPKKRTITKTTAMAASYDDTWAAIGDVLVANKWQAASSDKVTGVIATDWMTLDTEAHADCGVDPLASADREVKVRLVFRLKPEGTTTTVTIDATFQRLRKYDQSARVIGCASKGTLETELFAQLGSRLKIIAVEKEKQMAEASRPRFYCAAAPSDPKLATCARNEAECAKRRQALVDVAPDVTPCTKANDAFCFIGTNTEGVQVELCHPSADGCAAKRTELTTAPAQLEDAGECGPG